MFNVLDIKGYQTEPQTDKFYTSMTKRGFNINLLEKSILEQCEGKVLKYGSKRKDIFGTNNINCHDFYYLLADKYGMNYISYKLILSSLDAQTLKNLYQHIWVKWEELSNSVHNFLDDHDINEINKDDQERFIDLMNCVIENQYKYTPAQIDAIYNKDKLLCKILDSFYKFGKKKKMYAIFILQQFQNYFIN